MKTRIMLDLETLGTAPGSAILAIGAVKFTEGQVYADFYNRIDLQSCIDAGLVMDPQTVLWWLKQPDEARLEITKPGEPIHHVLTQFRKWIFEMHNGFVPFIEDIEMWGNGAAFDNTLLYTAYEKYGIKTPWKYSNDRCYRTVKNLYPDVPMPRTGTHHNALDDARSQAMHLMAMLPNL